MDEARPSQPTHLAVARIVAPRGLRGEVKAEILTDFPQRFRRGLVVYLGPEKQRSVVERVRLHRGWVLLKLGGYDNPEEAARLRGALVEVPIAEAVPLQEGEYFWHQIIGLRVMTVDGEDLGRVEDILPTGSNDVYVVKRAGGEILLPALDDTVISIDLAAGSLTIRLPEGLL